MPNLSVRFLLSSAFQFKTILGLWRSRVDNIAPLLSCLHEKSDRFTGELELSAFAERQPGNGFQLRTSRLLEKPITAKLVTAHELTRSSQRGELEDYQREVAFNPERFRVELSRGYAPVRILSPLELIHADEIEEV